MLGGLWEFPGGKIEHGESAPDAARREVQEEMAIEIEIGPRAAIVKHTYSHFGVTLHAYHACHLRGTPRPESGGPWTWARKANLVDYAFPAASRRIIENLPESYPEDPPD
jgi:A/G-specific adenine glycosylase